MKINGLTPWLFIAISYLGILTKVHGLNFFTAPVEPPDSQYSQLLSGNDVFETVYSTFNRTGLILLGSALLLSSGLFALPYLPAPEDVEDSLHKIRNGPLGFIPKPGFGKNKGTSGTVWTTIAPASLTTVKPVVYSFTLDEDTAKRNYETSLSSQGSNFDLGQVPGPPYKTGSPSEKKPKHKVYINVDHNALTGSKPKISTTSNLSNNHKVSQVIEPVVNTITNAIKKTFVDYHGHTHSRSADRRTVNPSLKFSYDANQNEEVISNDIEDNYNYGFPLDYYDYDVAPFATKPTKLSPAATSLTPKYFHGSEKDYYAMEKLSKLKKMYTPSPIRNRYGKPKFTTKRSEHSYYVYPTPKSNSNPYY